MVAVRPKRMHDRLLDAAEDAFAGRGYDVSPLEEIAATVGISASAIYKHYRNKMALLKVDQVLAGNAAQAILEADERARAMRPRRMRS